MDKTNTNIHIKEGYSYTYEYSKIICSNIKKISLNNTISQWKHTVFEKKKNFAYHKKNAQLK